MIASVRRAVADLDWEQLGMLGGAVLALLLVTAAIVSGSRTTTSTPARVTYCAATATPTTPRCPPEPNTTVTAPWLDARLATVTWTGREWQLRVPGGLRAPVAAPHDWSNP